MLTRTQTLLAFVALSSVALTGCPLTSSSGGGNVPSGSKNLTPQANVGDLIPSDLNVLCLRNESTLRSLNSVQTQCMIDAADKDTEADCNAKLAECTQKHSGDPAQMCQTPGGTIECDASVQEVEDCLRQVSAWAGGLTCAMAGKVPAAPACSKTLEGSCAGIDELYSDKVTVNVVAADGGADMSGGGDAGADSGGGLLGCQPGVTRTCACPDSSLGSAVCGPRAVFGACQCSNNAEVDASVSPDGGGVAPSCDDYDLGAGAECNTCAMGACCQSYADCRADTDCNCFWSCLNLGGADCATECGLATDYPDLFVTHSLCLQGSCQVECGL